MTVRILVHDHRLQAWARAAPTEADRAVRQFITAAGPVVTRHMKLATRVFKRPRGALRASIRWHRVGSYTIRVQPHVPYADFVNYPTRPHIIRPKNRKALTIPPFGATLGMSKSGMAFSKFKFGGKTTRGGVLFRVLVRHPGTRGHFFVERAKATAEPELDRRLRVLLQRRLR